MTKTRNAGMCVTAVFAAGLLLAGCPTEPETEVARYEFVHGPILNLTGRIWIASGGWNDQAQVWETTYTGFTGFRSLSTYFGAGGYINAGWLDFTLDSPDSGALAHIVCSTPAHHTRPRPDVCRSCYVVRDLTGWAPRYPLSVSDPEARAVWLGSMETQYGGSVFKSRSEFGEDGVFSETVGYMFVDRDVTITRRFESETETFAGYGITTTNVFEAFSLPLRAGWNAIHARSVTEFSATTSRTTNTVAFGIPAGQRWVLFEIPTDGEVFSHELAAVR